MWQGRYKSSLIDSDNYFIWCGIYNELNPVRAGLAMNPEDWKWSSFRFYGFGNDESLPSELIDIDPCYLEMDSTQSGRCKKYREDIKKPDPQKAARGPARCEHNGNHKNQNADRARVN